MLFVIVALSGFAGFLVSFALLSAGWDSMAWRYGIAGAGAYATFLCLLAVYVAWQRSGRELDPDPTDVFDLADLSLTTAEEAVPNFSGGRSGGGGAANGWDSSVAEPGGSWFDADVDFGFALIALAAIAACALAVSWVLWAAPALLAEVLVDAVIVGTVSKQLGSIERRDWTATVLRRTWFPAAVMVLTLVVGGWALQQAVPDAKSIGPAVQSIFS